MHEQLAGTRATSVPILRWPTCADGRVRRHARPSGCREHGRGDDAACGRRGGCVGWILHFISRRLLTPAALAVASHHPIHRLRFMGISRFRVVRKDGGCGGTGQGQMCVQISGHPARAGTGSHVSRRCRRRVLRLFSIDIISSSGGLGYYQRPD